MPQRINPMAVQRIVAQAAALDHINNTGKNLPATVSNVKGSILQINFETGSGFTLPKVIIPAYGPEYTRYPYQKGDKGIVIAADSIIGNMDGLGSSSAPGASRPGNLSPLIFIPIGNSNWTAPDDPNAVINYGPTGTISRDTNKNTKHSVHPTNGVTSQTGAQGPVGNPTSYNGTHTLHPTNGLLATIVDATNGNHSLSIVPQGGSGALGWLASLFGGNHSHAITSTGHDIKSSAAVKLDAPAASATGSFSVAGALSALSAAFSSMSGGGGFGVSSGGALTASSAAINGALSATGPIQGPILQLTPGLTVAALNSTYPPASYPGCICYVTDATAPTWHSTLVGGAAVQCLAFSNGTNWIAA